jgi:hypothetical protein
MRTGFVFLYLMIFLLSIVAIVVTIELQETTFNRQRIGETVVICGDTLTIDDYNKSYKYYILSNGLIYECK